MNVQKKEKGFTIIEVVLVLAIAALIFLMIFVALPALQRNQANGARKNDVGAVVSAIGTYRTNTRGTLPSDAGKITPYLDNGLSRLDMPTTAEFNVGPDSINVEQDNLDKVYIHTRAKCNSSDPAANTTTSGSSREAAVLTIIQVSAGENGLQAYCQNA